MKGMYIRLLCFRDKILKLQKIAHSIELLPLIGNVYDKHQWSDKDSNIKAPANNIDAHSKKHHTRAKRLLVVY
jgi:hypothetical protein